MLQELKKLRDKTLSFGCILKDPSDQLMVFTHDDGKVYRGLYSGHMGGIARICPFEIIGHPLTWGRICYLYYNMDAGPEDESDRVFDRIQAFFFYNHNLFDQNETQRMSDKHRPDLFELLKEFAALLPSNETHE